MSQSNVAGWLPALIGPVSVQVSGVAQPARSKINFAGATSTDDPNTDTLTIQSGGGAYNPAVTTWLTTPSSANLLAALSNETGTGLVVFGTAPTFKTTISLRNPADTFSYIFTPAAIAADRTLNLPLLTATDTVAVLALAQTLTNKTMVAASNTITDTSAAAGDLFKHNGTRFVRFARGTANQVLTTNGAGTDLAWATPSTLGTNVASGTNFISIGATPAASGNGLRLRSLYGLYFRNAANSADVQIMASDASDRAVFGSTDFLRVTPGGGDADIIITGEFRLTAGSGQSFRFASAVTHGRPVTGDAAFSSPWGAVDGQVVVAVSTVNITLAANQYNTAIQKFTGAPAATRTITYPLPATDAESYTRVVWCQTTVSGLTITNGGGLTVAIVANDAPHVLLFTPTGVVKIT